MIETRSLTKVYGGTAAVDGIDFQVKPGLVTGFLGPNGAGAEVTLEPDGTLGVVGLGSRRIGELAAERAHVLYQLRDVTASLEEAYFRLTGESVEYRAAAAVTSGAAS
jgi:ABC-type uncharacterized transport system ATPase subunit